jgi:hypothetical protein
MGELVAWGLGLGLGYSVRNMLIGWQRIALFAVAIIVLGGLITLFSGELANEPWLVLVDIAQVGAAALIGAYAVPFVRTRVLQVRRPEAP